MLPRLGGAVELCAPASEVRWGGQEELPCLRGQGPRPGGATPTTQARGQGGALEEQPQVQGAKAVRAQEGLEKLLGRIPYKTAAAPFCFMAPVHVSVENAQ